MLRNRHLSRFERSHTSRISDSTAIDDFTTFLTALDASLMGMGWWISGSKAFLGDDSHNLAGLQACKSAYDGHESI